MGWDKPVLLLSPPLLMGVVGLMGHPGRDAGSKTCPFRAQIANDFNPSFSILFFQEGRKEIRDLGWPEVRETLWAQRTEERLSVSDRPLFWDADDRYLQPS